MDSPRSLSLVERRPRRCRLPRRAADYLLSHHRPHVELIPDPRRGLWHITALGYVGTIDAPGLRLVLRPKVPLANLLHLLDPDDRRSLPAEPGGGLFGDDLVGLVAGRFADLLATRVNAGLHRGYREESGERGFLSGRLDVAAHLRGRSGRPGRFPVTADTFTDDLPCNQFPRAAAVALLTHPDVPVAVRRRLEVLLAAFEGVSDVRLGPFPDGPTPPGYGPLLEACRLLAAALLPPAGLPGWTRPTFLLDAELIFERHVTAGVRTAFAGHPGWEAAAQSPFLLSGPANVTLRPDVTVLRDGEPWAVVDAKWKRSGGVPVYPADVQQVLAYGAALGARRAVLVYPGRHDRVWRWRLDHRPAVLEVRTLRVVGSRRETGESLGRLGRALCRD